MPGVEKGPINVYDLDATSSPRIFAAFQRGVRRAGSRFRVMDELQRELVAGGGLQIIAVAVGKIPDDAHLRNCGGSLTFQ